MLLAHHLEVLIRILHLIEEYVFVANVAVATINVFKYRIFHAAETEAAIKDCPAVVFVPLAKSRVLVELGKDFVQGWHWRLCALLGLLLLLLLVMLSSVEHVLPSNPLVAGLTWV